MVICADDGIVRVIVSLRRKLLVVSGLRFLQRRRRVVDREVSRVEMLSGMRLVLERLVMA